MLSVITALLCVVDYLAKVEMFQLITTPVGEDYAVNGLLITLRR